MPISIKNPETELLARKLAALTGETITDAVRLSLEQRYEQVKRAKSGRSMVQDLRAIVAETSKLPVVCAMTDDELLGYDEFGAPKL